MTICVVPFDLSVWCRRLDWVCGWGTWDVDRWHRAPGSPVAFFDLCKKCRQTPIFILQVSPHFFSLSAVGAQSRAEGMRLVLVSSGVALRTDGLLTSLCKKCRQTPILIIPLFPHFLHSPHSASRAVLRAREWIRTARVSVSERGDCFGPSAKSVGKPLF